MSRNQRIDTRLWESGVCAGFGVLSTIAGATGHGGATYTEAWLNACVALVEAGMVPA